MNEPIQWISWIKHGVVFGYLIAMYMFLISMAVGAHLVTLFAKRPTIEMRISCPWRRWGPSCP